jgi:hypothetical protein
MQLEKMKSFDAMNGAAKMIKHTVMKNAIAILKLCQRIMDLSIQLREMYMETQSYFQRYAVMEQNVVLVMVKHISHISLIQNPSVAFLIHFSIMMMCTHMDIHQSVAVLTSMLYVVLIFMKHANQLQINIAVKLMNTTVMGPAKKKVFLAVNLLNTTALLKITNVSNTVVAMMIKSAVKREKSVIP